MPRKSVKITDDQRGWNRLKSNLFLQRGRRGVFVGILEEDGDKKKLQLDGSRSDASLAEVAFYNEMGTSTIPARSFIRAPFDETKGYEKLRRSILKRVAQGVITMEQALNILGSSIAKSFRKRIGDGNFAPNAEATIQSKLADTPLIATEELLEHIAYKLNKGE